MNHPPQSGAFPGDGTDVLIVGAGPTGLMLGCELRRLGVECTVIDQAPGIDPRTRAVMVHAASLETLEDLGLRAGLERQGVRQHRIAFHLHHGAAHTVEFAGLDTPYPYYLNVPQPVVEQALATAFTDRGGRLLRPVRYAGHRTDGPDGRLLVELEFDQGVFGLPARYLVGADGASSGVRQHLGIAFDGVTYPMSYLLAEGSPRQAVDPDASAMYVGPGGAVSLLPLPGGLVRIAGPAAPELLGRDEAVTGAAFARAVDALGFGATLRLARTDRLAHYQVHERLAATFHSGRAVLAGDAAHLNSPAGGQAMNTGFADASALAWRLAALVEGRADERVLADYAGERRHAAAEVGRATSALGLLQAMREATTQELRQRVQETLAGYAEAWSQLYTTYAPGPAAALPRRETYQLVPGARVPGHVPHPSRPVALFRPGIHPEAYRGVLPAGTRPLALTTRQSAWLPAGADAVLVRPDRHVAAVLAPGTRRPDGTPEPRREEVAA
ncbi:NAD(P)/FAD-dependent oxidoreductase [Streptomyces sp. NPDC007863]|uniref:FAD-dependent oxidoreductase n=1 Tax=Streptomyces sp. NPDC007863 TaxID=3154894 RepID=UPI0033FAF192